MKNKYLSKFKRLIIVVPIAIAIAIVGGLVRAKKGPEKLDLKEKVSAVRVIRTQAADVVPRAIGYGYVLPGQTWQAVAEVSGKVAEVSPVFKKGSLCKQGITLVRIDPTKYKLAIAQNEANIQSIRAQIAELDVQEQNYKALLEIEEKSLALSKKELNRKKTLFEKNTIAASQYDQQMVSYYAQLTKVQNLKNSLSTIPANRKSLKANLELSQVKLEDAKLDLAYTEISVPFDCRITEVKVEQAQFVQKGQVIALADGTKSSEITAQIPMDKMMSLMKSVDQPPAFSDMDMAKLREIIGIEAIVRLKSGDVSVEWDATLARMDATIDPQTRTVGVIVAVSDSYQKMVFGKRPPLVRNMFCEVELRGRPISGTLVIPRSALHEDHVYVADSENRLKRKEVVLDFSQSNFYAIREGLSSGEQLIVSDLIPAIEGMLLEPRADEALEKKLMAEAAGDATIQ